jgi:outer membrane protein assembly complex protein YaeT
VYAWAIPLLILPPWVVAAQESQFEGRKIADIQYQPTKQPLDPRDLAEAQPLKSGEPLRLADVATAIDRLYATGQYEDIRVEAEPGTDGVIVRFITEERWFVGHVGAEGKLSNPPNRGLVSATAASQLGLGQPFDEEALADAKQQIEQLFESNGLYAAGLQSSLLREPDVQQLNLTFAVNAGKRAKYEKPLITGNAVLSDDTIIRATGWRFRFIGWYRKVTEARTRNAMTGVLKAYQKKDRLMATARVAKLDYDAARNRLKPTLEVNAGPKVDIRAVETEISKGKLRKYVPVYDERRVDRDLLVEGARNLRDYFQSQGYYDVDVEFRQREEDPDQLIIEYVISRGQRYKLVEVKVEGNDYFDDETIRERMFLEEAGLIRLRHGRYSEAMRSKDEENVTNLYKSNGFQDVKVGSTVERNHQGNLGDIGVTLRIEEGPQWLVDQVDVKGVNQLERDLIMSLLSSLPGQPYSEYNIAVDRTTILTQYHSAGFPEARFRFRVSPAGDPNRVNIEYDIVEGRRQYVRDVLVAGLTNTRSEVVNNSLTLEPGDPLALTSMTEGQQNLYNRGIFAKVETAVQNPEGRSQYKYVLYDIEEAHRYNVNVGVGAEVGKIGGTTTSLDQPVGGNGFSPRLSLDLTRHNFLGRGHQVSLRGRVSNLEQRASFNYIAPRFRNVEGRNITFTTLFEISRNVRTFSSRRQEASIQISQQFSKPTTGLFRITYRRVATSDVVIPALLVPALLQPVRLGLISANIAQDRRNDPTDPRRGIYNTVDLSLASSIFGSQRNFLRTLVRNATYHRVSRDWTFARQTTFGVLFPFNVPAGLERNDAVPLPERFFGGGNISHRGFPENQAGPRDIGRPAGPGAPETQPTGFPLGGNAILFNTLELRFPLLGDNISGVLFHDAGNVYRSINDISFRMNQRDLQDFSYMVHAAGFGIRYKTPVGPVRVDLAYSINPPSFVGFDGSLRDLLECNPNLPPDQLPAHCRGTRQNVGHFQFFFSIGQTF